MISCWNLDFHQRPKFSNLQFDVSVLLEAVADYMQMSCSLNWKKGEELEDKSTTAVVNTAVADLYLGSTQDTSTPM